MRAGLELFFTALGYFTRLPVPAWVPWSPARLRQAAACLPLVGWLVGALGAAAYGLLALMLPATLAVILSMALTIRLTGALHEDGWADACDGLGGGWDKAQVLAIMKDSRIGSYGTLGLLLMLLAKAAALVELGAGGMPAVAAALLAAHALSRLAAVTLIQLLPYARADDSSKAAALAQPLAAPAYAFAALCGLLPLALLAATAGALSAALALLAAAALTIGAARLFLRRLGGYTGDLLGATQQATELATYLAILVAWNFT